MNLLIISPYYVIYVITFPDYIFSISTRVLYIFLIFRSLMVTFNGSEIQRNTPWNLMRTNESMSYHEIYGRVYDICLCVRMVLYSFEARPWYILTWKCKVERCKRNAIAFGRNAQRLLVRLLCLHGSCLTM